MINDLDKIFVLIFIGWYSFFFFFFFFFFSSVSPFALSSTSMVEFKVLLADAFAASSASFLAFFLAFFSAFLLAFSSSVSTDGVTAGVVVEDSLSFLFLSPSCFTGVAATGVSVFKL